MNVPTSAIDECDKISIKQISGTDISDKISREINTSTNIHILGHTKQIREM